MRFSDANLAPNAAAIEEEKDRDTRKKMGKFTQRSITKRKRREEVRIEREGEEKLAQKDASAMRLGMSPSASVAPLALGFDGDGEAPGVEPGASIMGGEGEAASVRCNLFAEMSIKDQIYREIDAAGSEGLFGTNLYSLFPSLFLSFFFALTFFLPLSSSPSSSLSSSSPPQRTQVQVARHPGQTLWAAHQ
jgi:hypothetical protein